MSLRIKNLTIIGKHDFGKIVCDVLRSLKVTTIGADAAADFDEAEIFNEIVGRRVITRLKITAGGAQGYVRTVKKFGAESARVR